MKKFVCIIPFAEKRSGTSFIIKQGDIAEQIYKAPHLYKIRFNEMTCWIPSYCMMPLEEYRNKQLEKLLK
jgi:hypothetical protein